MYWELSDTKEIDFVPDTYKVTLGKSFPEIMNSDQGNHFTSPKYTKLFLAADSRISMDHRGRAYDNIFIERLWRTVKYEDIYLKAYEYPREARIGINNYLKYYNSDRPHSSLKYKTPADIFLSESNLNFQKNCLDKGVHFKVLKVKMIRDDLAEREMSPDETVIQPLMRIIRKPSIPETYEGVYDAVVDYFKSIKQILSNAKVACKIFRHGVQHSC